MSNIDCRYYSYIKNYTFCKDLMNNKEYIRRFTIKKMIKYRRKLIADLKKELDNIKIEYDNLRMNMDYFTDDMFIMTSELESSYFIAKSYLYNLSTIYPELFKSKK
jgi:hypothetical protein